MSGSDREALGDVMKDSTVSEDEYRADHVFISNKPKEAVNEKYFHIHNATDKNYTLSCIEDKGTIENTEQRYAVGGKIQCPIPYPDTTETDIFCLNSKRELITCDRTEVLIEEGSRASAVEARAMGQDLAADGQRTCLSVRETEKTIFCHPVISKQIFGQRNALTDAMIRWWGPQINYSTTPSSQTQLSTYSVSINNFM